MATKKKNDAAICRDIGPQSKGPRLQRLRAVELLIKSLDSYPSRNEYVAVEFQGDVYASASELHPSCEYHEENKNYDPSSTFTMNSKEILNTLVSFVDCWVLKGMCQNVKFGFYTPNEFSKEKRTKRNTTLNISWPENPMMERLVAGQLDDELTVDSVKKSVIAEYRNQSESHEQDQSGRGVGALTNLKLLTGWTDNDWKTFLRQISWKFGEHDEVSLMGALVDQVQTCSEFNESLSGKEQIIIAQLVDLIDQRQSSRDLSQKFLHVSEILLVFKAVGAGSVLLPDPAWRSWEALAAVTDTRNLMEKVESACPVVSQQRRNRWLRRAAQSHVEQHEHADDKSILALKYQIYDACEEKLDGLTPTDATEEDLVASIQFAKDAAIQRHKDCKKQYEYRLKSDTSIEGVIFELFDSCFLSFDGGVDHG